MDFYFDSVKYKSKNVERGRFVCCFIQFVFYLIEGVALDFVCSWMEKCESVLNSFGVEDQMNHDNAKPHIKTSRLPLDAVHVSSGRW